MDRAESRRLATVACVLAFAAYGCDRPRLEPRVRVADAVASARGLREPPAVTIDAAIRPVLADAPIVALAAHGWAAPVPVEDDGSVTLAVACPDALAGRQVLAEGAVQLAQRPGNDAAIVLPTIVRAVERVRCPAPGEAPPRLRIAGLEPGLLVYPTFRGFVPPEGRIESPPLAIPKDARLEVAIGIASPRPAAERAASRFVVRGEDAAGRAVVVLDRRLDPVKRAAERGWVEVDVPLGRLAALTPPVRLVFETASDAADEEPAYPAWGDPTIVVPAAPDAPRRPSVVIVSLDTLRADHVGAYGFRLPTSPRLDRLAADGVLFERAFASANWTMPSHASMLTGVPPCVHGKSPHGGPLPAGLVPLAEILRREGYATAAFTENGHLDPATFHRGFEVFRADTSHSPGGPTGLVEETLRRGLAWLDARGDRDFLLFLHTYQVHAPYTPPERYRTELGVAATPTPTGELSDDPAVDAALYAAEVRYTDAVLGRLAAALAAPDLAERTILVVTSDHGEGFGEHDERVHGGTLYEEQLHIPLVWHAPGRIAAGRRVRDLVGLEDLVPTVLELLGLPVPPVVSGLSLLPVLRPGAPPAPLPSRVLSSVNLTGTLALRGEAWKVIHARPPKTFDLIADPGERQPSTAPPPPAMVAAHRAYLAACERGRAMVAGTGESEGAPPIDPEREQKLRALGYVP